MLGEPLVDTPSSVIERVLHHYEATHRLRAPEHSVAANSVPSTRTPQPDPATRERQAGVLLVPARPENLAATIRNSVPLDVAREVLSDEQFVALSAAIAPAKEFHCWATTEANKAVYSALSAGDEVLITEKGTGRFNYRGRVVTKVISEALAARLWPDVPELPWKLIYVLERVQRINVRKDALVAAFGYDRNFWVPGHIRVSRAKLAAALEEHGTFEKLLTDCK
jgi:hypothetical protein